MVGPRFTFLILPVNQYENNLYRSEVIYTVGKIMGCDLDWDLLIAFSLIAENFYGRSQNKLY